MITSILEMARMPLFVLGLAALFAGDRYFSTESTGKALMVGGFVAMFLAIALALFAGRSARRAGRTAEACGWKWPAAWMSVVVAGCGMYLVYEWRLSSVSGSEIPAIVKILLGGSLLLLISGIAAGIGVEYSFRECGRGDLAEPRRVRLSGATWLLSGLLFTGLLALNYAGYQRNKSWDWSYLKTARPGTATISMVKAVQQPAQVVAFYPPTNEVRPYVEEYLGALAQQDPRVKVSYVDKDTSPRKAEDMRVTKNGVIVLERDGRTETIDIGMTTTAARSNLRTLDAKFQKSFLALTGKARKAYFTRGHGEMTWLEGPNGDPLRQVQGLEEVLRNLNYSVHMLGMKEGLATAIPDDATVVIVASPVEPFLPEEVESLKAYAERGGRILVYLDSVNARRSEVKKTTGADDPLRKWLGEIGVTIEDGVLCNDRSFVKATRSPADVAFVFSNSFTSHESVSTLARHDDRLAVIFFQSGFLTVSGQAGAWKAQETLRALPDTFLDANRNFTFDTGEERKSYSMTAVAVREAPEPVADPAAPKPDASADTRLDGRVFVAANGALISDALMRNPGNLLFAAETLKWVTGDTAARGETQSEEDIKVLHTRKEDMIWFYGSVLAVPLLVLAAGWYATRRRRRRPTDLRSE